MPDPVTIAPAAVCARGGCHHPYSDHEPQDPEAPCYHGASADICLCSAFVLGPPPPRQNRPDDRNAPEPDESGMEMPYQAGAWRE